MRNCCYLLNTLFISKQNMIKKILNSFIGLSVILSPFAVALPAYAAAPEWQTTGSYVINMEYLGPTYAHDLTLVQDGLGGLTGGGGHPAAGPHAYTWVLTSGSVSSSTIDFLANYTASADAVTPQTTMHVMGTIAPGGTMSGTWTDNYAGGARAGSWSTSSGTATPITILPLPGALAGEDFGVVSYDTGLGILAGYSAGFGLTGATLASTTSVVVRLYAAGDVLLQTNTAILPKFNADITGTQFTSPFDVSGTFAYATDGYWANVRQAQFGQSVPAVKVTATVTLANGKVVTATNTNMVGNPSTIYPVVVPTATTTAVHLVKYIDGVKATALNAAGVSFPMFTSTYNAPFTLGPVGWTTGDSAYEASTSAMPLGSAYSANENLTTPLVGAVCDANHTYALVGYGIGNTLTEAAAATTSTSTPTFTNLQTDKYIVVKNTKCTPIIVDPPTVEPAHIVVIKSTLPNDGQDFSFTNTFGNGNPATFSLDDDSDTTLPNMRDSTVLAGTYSIAETAMSGWTTLSATCSNGNPVTAISVAAGQTVYCVFVNAKVVSTTTSISGMKYNDLNRNGKKNANEPGLAGWTIKLTKGTSTVTTVTDANGNYTFTQLAPGTYKVREVNQNGWKRMSKNPKAIVVTTSSIIAGVNFGNATKYRYERDDNSYDDDRDDDNGYYYSNQGRSNYENDNGGRDNNR